MISARWFAQPFFIQSGLKVTLFGVAWDFLNLSVGFAAMYAWRIESGLGPKRTVMLFTLFLVAGYFGLALMGAIAVFLMLLIFYMARGLATPTLRNYINIIATSDTRATVLSVRNFIIRGLFALFGPLYGMITDRFGLSTLLILAGVIFSFFSSISIFFFLMYKTYQR